MAYNLPTSFPVACGDKTKTMIDKLEISFYCLKSNVNAIFLDSQAGKHEILRYNKTRLKRKSTLKYSIFIKDHNDTCFLHIYYNI